MSAHEDSWPAFVVATLVTGALALSIVAPIRYLTAWEIAQFVGFVVAASLAVIVALRWLCGLFRSSGPRAGAATGVFAALAVLIPMVFPTLMSHPSRYTSESATIGDMRTIILAEAAYQAASGGAYGSPECLAAPTACLHDYSANQPTFLDSQIASLVPKNGYKRVFHPGAAAPPPADGKPAPKDGLASYAYTAVPVRLGLPSTRGFCADSTGRICFTTDGTAPAVADGLCAATCQDLR